MAPTNTRQTKNAKNAHDVSSSSDSEGEKEKDLDNTEPLALSEAQLGVVSLLVKSAVAAAVAQVLPLRDNNTQNATEMASPGTSAQGKQPEDSGKNSEERSGASKEEGEVIDEELDEYEKELRTLLGDAKVTGPEISEKISRILERCLGNPLDDKVVKLKRDSYPRPENVSNLKVPRTNPLIFSKISSEHQGLDRAMQVTQSYLVGGITAVGLQAEKLLGIRTWVSSLDQEDKERLPEELQQLMGMYVHLMDALIMLIRTMSDMTNLRRRMIRNDLVEPYKSLMEEEKNPPTPDWLGGDDVPGAIRKAKANANLADDIAKRGKWPRKSFNRNSRNYNSRPYENNPNNKKRKRDSDSDSFRSNYRGGRGRGDHRNSGDRKPADFWRRDSR